MHKINSHRWWEFYLIRYALGTVVGAICVYYTLHILGPDAKSLWLMQPKISREHIDALVEICKYNKQACLPQAKLAHDLEGFNFQQLILLGIYGLAFNYFASAPILVWHALRYQLFNTCEKKDVSCCSKWLLRVIYNLILLTVVSVSLNSTLKYKWFDIAIIVMILIYISMQVVMIFLESSKKSGLYDFYVQLHQARRYPRVDLDSYKHLREHGNAFLIVIHNVMLLAVILSLNNTIGVTGVMLALFWIFPAAYIYFLAHGIEADMLKDKRKIF